MGVTFRAIGLIVFSLAILTFADGEYGSTVVWVATLILVAVPGYVYGMRRNAYCAIRDESGVEYIESRRKNRRVSRSVRVGLDEAVTKETHSDRRLSETEDKGETLSARGFALRWSQWSNADLWWNAHLRTALLAVVLVALAPVTLRTALAPIGDFGLLFGWILGAAQLVLTVVVFVKKPAVWKRRVSALLAVLTPIALILFFGLLYGVALGGD